MGTISKDKQWHTPHFSRAQLRYAAMYVLITSVVLLFLNLYAASTTRDLTFKSKKSQLSDKTAVAAAAMGEVPVLNSITALQVLDQMYLLNAERVLVTDKKGYIIYDSLEKDNAMGRVALLPEVVWALEGSDVCNSQYNDGTLESRAATPILRSGELSGCIYLMESDPDQGSLIQALLYNILWTSLFLEIAVILCSLFFSSMFSRRMLEIFKSIGIIRDGDYSHKVEMSGSDELAILAKEFNTLTERLQDSEERRRQFVSDASHELKTPLTSIKLLSDSILQNPMDMDTIFEFVQDIGNEADRLTRMSQKLLYLTKMDAKQENEREISDISATVGKVFRMLHPVADLNNITLVNHTAPGATILAIEDTLYQIVFNLVENGIKYNKPNGTLTVDLQRSDGDWVLKVTDTGVGIPDDAIPYIFERFYRVDKARSREAGGSGLGLSIVYGMVEQNEGTISVSRTEAGGTCFCVVFPAFDVEDGVLWVEE